LLKLSSHTPALVAGKPRRVRGLGTEGKGAGTEDRAARLGVYSEGGKKQTFASNILSLRLALFSRIKSFIFEQFMFNHNFSVMGVNKNQTVKAGFAGFVLVAVVVVFFAMFSIERIDSGQTGIIVNLAGSERGIDDAKVETGWVMYNRFAKQLFEYPAFAQIVDYEPFDIQDKKGTIFKTDPTIEYYIERENAKLVFLRYRKTTQELEQSVILTEVKNAYKDVAGVYETDSLINNRPAFEKEVEALLKERLSQRGFTFSNIQSSVKPNEVLQAAIDAKNTAVQNALKVENEKKAAIAEAEKVVAAAKGKADANRILQESITPELIQLKAVEKWDGKLPLSTSGNTLPFLKLQ